MFCMITYCTARNDIAWNIALHIVNPINTIPNKFATIPTHPCYRRRRASTIQACPFYQEIKCLICQFPSQLTFLCSPYVVSPQRITGRQSRRPVCFIEGTRVFSSSSCTPTTNSFGIISQDRASEHFFSTTITETQPCCISSSTAMTSQDNDTAVAFTSAINNICTLLRAPRTQTGKPKLRICRHNASYTANVKGVSGSRCCRTSRLTRLRNLPDSPIIAQEGL